jgi:predicted MPP superfamily phosphohydrolase
MGGIFIILFTALPVLLLVALLLIGLGIRRAAPGWQKAAVGLVASGFGFALFDTLLLNALPLLNVSYGPVGFSIGILAYARALLLIVFAALLLRQKPNPRRAVGITFWALNGLLTLLVVYGFYIEPFDVKVTHLQVNVPAGVISRPVRILELSDIHVERTTRRESVLPGLIEREAPDMVVLTGDYLNLSYLDDPLALSDARRLFSQIHAPLGAYAIQGTVDEPLTMQRLFDGTDITILDNEVKEITVPGGMLSLVGISNQSYWQDKDVLSWTAPYAAGYRILLYHTPDLVEEAAAAGINLYLAGHTHGGQVRLPFYGALVTFSVHGKKYEAGRYQFGQTTLYVSRGLGMEGSIAPRVRFLCPPEIVVIDLVPEEK